MAALVGENPSAFAIEPKVVPAAIPVIRVSVPSITGSDFLMNGVVTAAYWCGLLAPK